MRVVAGRFGGRRLRAPRGDKTRPTADRVKEALFSVLGPLDGAIVADVFAGTGALGIEALSRGADKAVFVEAAPAALAILRENLASLSIGPTESAVITVVAERATHAVAKHGPFDLILLDPPYASLDLAVAFLASLLAQGAVIPGGRAVLEHASSDAPSAAGWDLVERRRYGDSTLTFLSAPTASHTESPR